MKRVDRTRRRLLEAALATPAMLYGGAIWASVDAEREIADKWWAVYMSGKHPKLPRHGNAEAERALQAIAAPLCRVSTRRDLEWRVGLLKVPPRDINAFTCGGGVMFVHDALIAFCSNETELATVIGHEIGHIEHRHSIKRMYAEAVLKRHGIDPNIDNRVFRQALEHGMHELVADRIVYRSYTRLWEYQADAFALRALHAGGYDPSQAHTFFEKLLALYPGRHDINTCLVNTHPENQDRISRMKALARGYARTPPRRDSAMFRDLAAELS